MDKKEMKRNGESLRVIFHCMQKRQAVVTLLLLLFICVHLATS